MTDQPSVEPDSSTTPLPDRPSDATTNVSGGVDLNAQGDVTIGGDVVGRDKITEIVEGDKVAGDKIIEQQITATGRGIAIGKLNIPLVPLMAALGLGLGGVGLHRRGGGQHSAASSETATHADTGRHVRCVQRDCRRVWRGGRERPGAVHRAQP